MAAVDQIQGSLSRARRRGAWIQSDARPIPRRAWIQDVDGEAAVCYEWGPWRKGAAASEHSEILMGFRELADSDSEAFRAFAMRFGPLTVCDSHGLPYGHPPFLCGPLIVDREERSCYTPLEVWRSYSRALGAAMRIAEDHDRGKCGDRHQWKAMLDTPNHPERQTRRYLEGRILRPIDLEEERMLLAYVLDWWITLAQIRPHLSWESGRHHVGFAGGGTYGAVVRELVFYVAKVEGAVFCAGCGKPFTPDRRPARGRLSWNPLHPECLKIKARNAKRRERERKRRSRKEPVYATEA